MEGIVLYGIGAIAVFVVAILAAVGDYVIGKDLTDAKDRRKQVLACRAALLVAAGSIFWAPMLGVLMYRVVQFASEREGEE